VDMQYKMIKIYIVSSIY